MTDKDTEQIKKDYVKNCTWKRWNKLDPRIKECLRPYTVHRPRPLVFLGWRNGKRVYCTNRSLSYWQLKEKYPPPRKIEIPRSPHHVFEKRHLLAIRESDDAIMGYTIAGLGIVIGVGITVFYVICIIKALL